MNYRYLLLSQETKLEQDVIEMEKWKKEKNIDYNLPQILNHTILS